MAAPETPLVDLVVEDVEPFPEDVAPKQTRGRGRPKSEAPYTPPYRKGAIAAGFTKIYGSAGMALFMVDQQCGKAVIENAETMAQSLETLAKDNPAVRRVLSKMLTTSAWSEVIIAHAPLVIAIASHHVPVVKELTSSLFGHEEESE